MPPPDGPLPPTLGVLVSRARWHAILVFVFGVTIIPWAFDFLLWVYMGCEQGTFYDLSNHPADEHASIALYITTHWVYAFMAITSAIAIFFGKTWAPQFWLVTCVVILIGVSIETVAYGYDWTAYWFEALFSALSLVCYRSDLAKGWLRHASP